jgi:hypothetical protein
MIPDPKLVLGREAPKQKSLTEVTEDTEELDPLFPGPSVPP